MVKITEAERILQVLDGLSVTGGEGIVDALDQLDEVLTAVARHPVLDGVEEPPEVVDGLHWRTASRVRPERPGRDLRGPGRKSSRV